jgi:hypothetical protein
MGESNLLTLVPSILSSVVLAAGITAFVTWKLGVKGHEREARRDEHEAEDRLSARALAWVERLQAEVDAMRREWEMLRERNIQLDNHIDVLEAHIWAEKPPPPPQRPRLPLQ